MNVWRNDKYESAIKDTTVTETALTRTHDMLMLESFALGHGKQGHFRNCSHKTTWYDLRLAPYLYWSWKTWLLEALLSQVHMTWSDISFPRIWLRKTDCNRNQLYRSTCYGHTSRLLSLNCQRIKKKRCMLIMSDKITWSSLTCFSCEIVLGSRREHMWPKCLSRVGKSRQSALA